MIGLLPCAGSAVRFGGLPKFLLPCKEGYLLGAHVGAMGLQCRTVRVGCGENKKLIEQYAANAHCYFARKRATMAQTVMSAYKYGYTGSENILFGMPDTYFDFPLVYERLATRLTGNADVVLAVFKARPEQHKQGGMVSLSHNQVLDIVDKPDETTYQYIWGAMAWKPAFWRCLEPTMPHVGYGVKKALEMGLNVQAVVCAGSFYDCGTFERYAEMIRETT